MYIKEWLKQDFNKSIKTFMRYYLNFHYNRNKLKLTIKTEIWDMEYFIHFK